MSEKIVQVLKILFVSIVLLYSGTFLVVNTTNEWVDYTNQLRGTGIYCKASPCPCTIIDGKGYTNIGYQCRLTTSMTAIFFGGGIYTTLLVIVLSWLGVRYERGREYVALFVWGAASWLTFWAVYSSINHLILELVDPWEGDVMLMTFVDLCRILKDMFLSSLAHPKALIFASLTTWYAAFCLIVIPAVLLAVYFGIISLIKRWHSHKKRV